jgi:5-methylcytosine-specific restriction enzyme subunit McrC
LRRLAVVEYQRAAFPALPTAAARALHATGAVRVSSTLNGARTVIQARSIVGAVRVGTGEESVELHVRPKVGVSRLLWLLSHARDQSGWREDDVQVSQEAGLVTAMAVMFVARCRRALAAGVLHGYQEREEALPGLRGRLREADQVRARPGVPIPLEVRYDDYTIDIPENRLLRSAAIRLLALTGVPASVRTVLTRLARDLADAALLTPGSQPPRIAPTRLNRRYAPALHLARLVLERTSVENGTGRTSADGFLFDMNRVYEDWLTQVLTTTLEAHGGQVRRQQPLALDGNGRVIMQTDVTWWSGADCLAVVDAKYKRLLPAGPRPEDLYQILAYCTALSIRSGHLVYAAGTPSPVIIVRNAGVRIHTHVVPIADRPEHILHAVAHVAAQVAQGSSRSGQEVDAQRRTGWR